MLGLLLVLNRASYLSGDAPGTRDSARRPSVSMGAATGRRSRRWALVLPRSAASSAAAVPSSSSSLGWRRIHGSGSAGNAALHAAALGGDPAGSGPGSPFPGPFAFDIGQ